MTSDTKPNETSRLVALQDRPPGHAVIHALCTQPGSFRSRGRLARLFGVRPLSNDGNHWYQGALGEREVGRLLSKLGPGWTVLHAVPIGRRGADIDHVVVGPAGVFTINTKHHANQKVWVADRALMISGTRQHHIRNAEFECRRTANLLTKALGRPVPVTPVIAVVNAQKLTIRNPPTTVAVVDARRLVKLLKRQPAVLTPDDLAHLARLITDPTTWAHQPNPSADLDRRREFNTIHTTVRAARRTRIAWACIMVAASGMSAVLLVQELLRLSS
ncbi:nuclease-related domain-containing protein [Kribbella sp. NPDC003557]|uniref:nuclease-related domain-containing protein n=1 Tax=Kribbella sp. NPDC003557 TaxID=3154449 RepID=UPI0033A27B4A